MTNDENDENQVKLFMLVSCSSPSPYLHLLVYCLWLDRAMDDGTPNHSAKLSFESLDAQLPLR